MKYKEVKQHFLSGDLMYHYSVDENDREFGEYRDYHENGQLYWHNFMLNDCDCGEVKGFNDDGTLRHYYLVDGKGKEIATVVACGFKSTHSEEELIQIAKEHSLPLLTDIPKTEAELTHWNLKHPDLPCLSNAST